ncbi:MAG TPA: ABC transporter permease [Vicinamibacterales bacterium]|nr:ABC transporter permease [Vicinamibacterales bacterium]
MWVDDVRRDIAYGVRTLTRARGFATVAILTLGLGIGAATVIYSVVRNVVLDPFPYTRSDRMVNLLLRDASGRNFRGPYFPAAEFLDYQEQAQVFEDVVGTSLEGMQWVHENGADRLMIGWMTPNGFGFLGVEPMLGRVFGGADVAPGAPLIGVMNHRAWVRLFAADPGVLGRALMLNGQAITIVGVMPPRFEWNIADLWVPAAMSRADDPQSPRGTRAFQAHLKPGVSVAEAEAQLTVIAARRAAAHPAEYPPHFRMGVIKVIDWVVREFRGVLYTLFGAVTLLLLIACCNVANMLLARGMVREREIGIRAAIGASRGRIVRQLLVESALLAAGGLVAGCLLAYAGIAALAGYMPRQGVPWETEIRLDAPVLVFAMIAAAIATITFGLFPALQSARRDLASGTNLGGRTTAGRRQARLRGGLVIAQVALSIVLLLGAGVLMRTFVKLVNADLGFNPANLLVIGVAFPPRQNASPADQLRFYRQALERVGSIPDVRSVAVGYPFGGMGSVLQVPGLTIPQDASAALTFCSERLLDTLDIPLLRGRQFAALEVEQAHHVAIVNETLAKRYFGDVDPIGRTVRLPRLAALPLPVADPTLEIVGVVRDISNNGPREPPMPQVFLPFTLRGPAGLGFVARTSGDPLRVLDAARREIQAIDPQVALVSPEPLDSQMQRVFYARPRFSLLVLGIFACTGIVLVGFGVYGVLAYTVSQQSREIAIRVALGGARGDVIRMVLRTGLTLIGVGLAAGLGIGAATNRLLASQLWNTSAHDPLTLAVTVAVVCGIGLLACWIPARRAVSIQPIAALRQE